MNEPDEFLLFKEASVFVISESEIGMVFISGKPSGNQSLRNEIAKSLLAYSIHNSLTRFKKYFLNSSAARHR